MCLDVWEAGEETIYMHLYIIVSSAEAKGHFGYDQ